MTSQKGPILCTEDDARPMQRMSKKRAALALKGYLIKPVGICDLVDEVAKLIAETRIAFPVAVDCKLVTQNCTLRTTRYCAFSLMAQTPPFTRR